MNEKRTRLSLTQMKHILGHLRHIVLVHDVTFLVEHETKGKMCYKECEVISMLRFLSIPYLSSSKGIFSKKSSASPWEQSVLLILSIFTYSALRLSLYKNLSKTNQLQKLKLLLSLSGILMMFC